MLYARLFDELGDGACLPKAGFQHGESGRIEGRLLEVTHTHITAVGDFPFIVSLLTGEDIQQGCLSTSVLGYKSDTLTFGKAKRYITEKYKVAERFRQVLNL